MKKKSVLFLVACLFWILGTRVHGQVWKPMRVQVVSQNLIVADKGSRQGVQINAVYDIYRQGHVIGKARVLLIEEDLCGLKVIHLMPGFMVKLGDLLAKNSHERTRRQKKGYIYRPPKPNYCFLNLKNSRPASVYP